MSYADHLNYGEYTDKEDGFINYGDHINIQNDAIKPNPVNMTGKWPSGISDSFVDGNPPSLKSDFPISSAAIKQIRQNAKAIINEFRYGNKPGNIFVSTTGTLANPIPSPVPSFSGIPDSNVNTGEKINQTNINQTNGVVNPANAALLDDLKQGIPGVTIEAVSQEDKITKNKIDQIIAQLHFANQYANYVNHQNTGNKYIRDDYSNHTNEHHDSLFCFNHHHNTGSNYVDHVKLANDQTYLNGTNPNPSAYVDNL